MEAIKLPLKPSKEVESKFLEYLQYLYLNDASPVAFSAPQKILLQINKDNKYTNIGIRRLKKYLSTYDSYTLNRQRHTSKREFRRYVAQRINHQIELDLFSIERFAESNDNVKWILAAIDVFSKRGYLVPLQDKRSKTVADALDTIINQLPFKPHAIYTDRGVEFKSRDMVDYLKEKRILQFLSKASGHAQYCERYIGTLKRIFKAYRIENKTNQFIHKLPQLLRIYNNRIHSSIGMAPINVNSYNEGFIVDRIQSKWKDRREKPFSLKIGDNVRITTQKSIFEKYDHKYSNEIFQISKRYRKDKINIYELTSCDDPLIGTFYESELVYVSDTKDKYYEIESFLDEKRIGNDVYVYVKYLNYPNNKHCNQWILKKSLIDV